MSKQINIREELNRRDMNSCTTDFVNMYECANLSLDKKKSLVKLLSENVSNKRLSKFFEDIDYSNDDYLFKPYWYFTRHGVGPGSVPNYIHVLGVVDADNGSYFASDKVIQTKDLEEYELKEKTPNADDIDEKVRINIQNWLEDPIEEKLSNEENIKKDKTLKEEYGYYKDEPYCEEIADDLENGIWAGETSNGTPWELTIKGYSSDEFSPSFADYLAEEVSYPVRDGHLAYLGIEMILYKSSMESIFGYDGLDKLIPDLIKLDVDRETIDEWLSSSDPDAVLDFDYAFNIAFDEDEWEENDREDIDLPDEVTYDFYSLVDDDVDINSDDYNLDDVIADRLSDDYGYTHYGFEYDVNAESGDVYVYDIQWDISESLKENVSDNKYNIKETEEEIFDILGIEPENYKNSKHLLPQFRKLAREWDENNIWLKSDLGHYTKGKIVDETEDLVVVDESLEEEYTHFTYKSGANPYIAKTDKETQRILNKYKGKVKETKKGFYEIDDTKEDSFIAESSRPTSVEDYDNYGFLIAFNEKDDFGVREASMNRWPNESYDDYLQRVKDIAKSIIKKTPEYESADIYELLFDEDGYYKEDYFVTHVEGD